MLVGELTLRERRSGPGAPTLRPQGRHDGPPFTDIHCNVDLSSASIVKEKNALLTKNVTHLN